MKQRLYLAILSFLLTALTIKASGEPSYMHDDTYPFMIISKDTVTQDPTVSDEMFYKVSAGVTFKVNRTEIRPDDPFLQLWRTEILQRVNKEHLQLRRVYIRGAASPEGPYDNNIRLGRERAHALFTELQNNLTYQYLRAELKISSVNEDYGHLCVLMKEANDPAYAEVQQMYDSSHGDERLCKQKLQAAYGGRLWQRLLRDYFPKLRAARVILWFSEPDPEHAPAKPVVHINDTIRDTTFIFHTEIHQGVPQPKTDTWTARDSVKRHPLFAIKSNILFDALTFLNGEIEVPIGNRWSLMAEVTWPWWLQKSHNKWCNEMGEGGLELRYWFHKWNRHSTYRRWAEEKNIPLVGWFLGPYAYLGYYDFQFKRHNGRQGEFAGGGITAGYSKLLGRHWRFEVSLSAGATYTYYRKYHIDDNTEVQPDRDQHLWRDTPKGHDLKKLWLGPTKFKLSFSYLLYKKCKKQKGGAK